MHSAFCDHSGIKLDSSNRKERKMHEYVEINTQAAMDWRGSVNF